MYNVSALLRDIASGELQPVPLEWPATAVKAYFDVFLDPSSINDRPPLYVDLEYALALPETRLNDPIVLVHLEGRGLVAYEEPADNPHHVIADGNHRVALAAAMGRGLQSLILSRNQSERYETFVNEDGK